MSPTLRLRALARLCAIAPLCATARLFTLAALVAVFGGCATTKHTFNDLLGRNDGFSSLDTNGDGVISRSEAQAQPDVARAFDRIDTNRDANVNRKEWRAANTDIVPVSFKNLDMNGDGVISRREAESSRRSLRETFSQVDADGDGNVSNAEYQAATTNLLSGIDFHSVDRDGDGVLDRNEVKANPLLASHFDEMDVNGDSLISPEEFKWAQSH